MPLTINTNIASLSAQRNLNRTSSGLSVALQRLSSGYRINSAKDDAAGLAIASRFTAQINGYNQGARNAADAISLAQTAEGALDEVSTNLQRIRELAVQSANATNSPTDRQALQTEVDQLTQEISRVVQAAEFNGTKLLMGTEALTFQVGANADESDQITIDSVNLTITTTGSTQAEFTAATAMVDLLTNSAEVLTQNILHDVATFGLAIGTTFEELVQSFGFSVRGGVDWDFNTFGFMGADSAVLTINTASMLDNKEIDAAYQTFKAAVDLFNEPGVASRAQLITAAQTVADTYKPTSTDGTLNSYNNDLTAANTINISTAAGASSAISSIDEDLALVNTHRATFGAVQNRFESVIRNAENTAENLSAARSRIEDTDFAQVTAQLTKLQILQQAGISVLSQANALPQGVLSLLG